jgi:hypothetical protein
LKGIIYIFVGVAILTCQAFAQNHPNLILTKNDVAQIKTQLKQAPRLNQAIAQAQAEVDAFVAAGVDVPTPKDLAGGYTHEQHKKNFFMLQKAGVLYQLTGQEKYAEFVKKALFAYADLMPNIDRHPATRSYARGKFFWQCLNDANWLVYTSQAYDCVYGWFSAAERKKLNHQLFRPFADFLSVENPQFFNRIHNHSTWGNAAVGMIGLVMDDEELIQRALYGLDLSTLKGLGEDNDGGNIKIKGQKEAGFLAQIDHAFSPDGYYTEGPYYQRYAMYPFLVFAKALHNKRPNLKIFEYRDGVLLKAVDALIYQTNEGGEFFPINDSQKGMSYLSRELIAAVNCAYHYGDQNPSLLSIAERQPTVSLDITGLSTAKAIEASSAKPFVRPSVELTDGADGKGGAIGILRASNGENPEVCALLKYAKHGMGHGHFDKLGFSMYYGAEEVFQDYGSARWVNIEHKSGGGYLKENKTWAKQTIAHNTVAINQKSQSKGKTKVADTKHPYSYLFDASNGKTQVMSAKDTNSYEGVAMQRTMVMIRDEAFENPVILDLYRIENQTSSSYDLPLYYQGELMTTSVKLEPSEQLNVMGKSHGYQHLWETAKAQADKGNTSFTCFGAKRFFYSTTMLTEDGDEITMVRIGANDPKFNLRRDPAVILRRRDTGSTLFGAATEVHGSYSPVTEIPLNSHKSIKDFTTLRSDDKYTAVSFSHKDGGTWQFIISNDNSDPKAKHAIRLNGKEVKWQGAYLISKTN